MKVKELIKKLKKCDPEATVFTNQWQEMDINSVLSAKAQRDEDSIANSTQGIDNLVYIGDDFEELSFELKEDGFILKEIQ